MEADWKPRLIELIKQHALLKGDFTLRSGKKSSYYIDGRMITLHPEGAALIARGVLYSVVGEQVDAVGGPEMGAVPIVGAVCAMSHVLSEPAGDIAGWDSGLTMPALRGFVSRKDVKDHGTKKPIEGPIKSGDRVVIVEDTTTTAGQVVKCIRACKQLGCQVVKVIAVVDREDEAKANVEAEGCTFAPLVTATELGVAV